jgi:hypothetical protein
MEQQIPLQYCSPAHRLGDIGMLGMGKWRKTETSG